MALSKTAQRTVKANGNDGDRSRQGFVRMNQYRPATRGRIRHATVWVASLSLARPGPLTGRGAAAVLLAVTVLPASANHLESLSGAGARRRIR